MEYYIGDGEIIAPESLLDSVKLSGISHFGITACLAIPELRGLIIGIYFLIFRHKGTDFEDIFGEFMRQSVIEIHKKRSKIQQKVEMQQLLVAKSSMQFVSHRLHF